MKLLEKSSFDIDNALNILSKDISKLYKNDKKMLKTILDGFYEIIRIISAFSEQNKNDNLLEKLYRYKKRQKLRFGDIVAERYSKNALAKNNIETLAIMKPVEKKIGLHLKEAGEVTKSNIIDILNIQKDKYLSLLDEIPEARTWLLPAFNMKSITI